MSKFRLPKNIYLRESLKILFVSIITVGLELIVYYTDLPHPILIFVMAIIAFVTLLGPLCGFPPFILALVYSLYYFSDDHSFIHFTGQNIANLVVSYVCLFISFIFIGLLSSHRRRYRLMLEKDNDELKNKVSIDYLTGIYNRVALGEYINNNLNKDINLCVFDIDNFKSFNDTHGHDFGDEVLRKVCDGMMEVF